MPTDVVLELKSKNGLATLAGSLIQLRLSIQNFAIAVHVDDETQNLSQYNNFLNYGTPKAQGLNVNNNNSDKSKNKSEIGKFSEDYEMLDYMMCQNYTTYSTIQSDPNSPNNSNSLPQSSHIDAFTPTSVPSSFTPTNGDYDPYDGPKISPYTATSGTVKSATILGTTTSTIKRHEIYVWSFAILYWLTHIFF